MTATSRARKVLLPLTVLLAAGALAAGSSATFTSASSNTVSSVTSGTLQHINSKNGQAIFNLAGIKPGDTLDGSLTITNTGSLPANFGLTEVSSDSTFTGEHLTLSITNTTTGDQVYSGAFGGLEDGRRNDLGVVEPGVANTYTFSVTLAQSTPNSQQGKTASAVYSWDSVQLDSQTFTQ